MAIKKHSSFPHILVLTKSTFEDTLANVNKRIAATTSSRNPYQQMIVCNDEKLANKLVNGIKSTKYTYTHVGANDYEEIKHKFVIGISERA